MSIRCVCPTGHVLKVMDSLAGTSGLCPICKKQVKVPQLRSEKVSEEAILGILGSQPAAPHIASATRADQDSKTNATSHPAERHERGTPKKSCYKCNLEISAGTHICPHCHTYIAKLDDF
jgi:hypothetical protein